MQTMLRLGAAVARHDPRLRRLALRAGDHMVMACALGGPVPLFGPTAADERSLPVVVLVRGGPQVDRYVLYECDDLQATDRSAFRPLDTPALPLYGGGIRVFRTDNYRRDRAYFVRAYAGDRRHDSEIMPAPIGSQPTRHAVGELMIAGAGAPGSGPTLDWSAIDAPGWVSFLILRRGSEAPADPEGLIVAVYAWGRRWRYPDLAATPFHYLPLDSPGAALPAKLPSDAEALYFAVQRDGWISAFARRAPIEAGAKEPDRV